MNKACDIAIIGGGLAGASLAVSLAPLGYKIIVVEAVAHQAAEQPSYDDRTLAINHGSCRILTGIGLWDDLRADATAIKKIFISELNRPGEVVLDPEEMGLTEFGHIIEARRFGAAVTAAMQAADNIEMLCPASVCAIETYQDTAVLSLDTQAGEQIVEARLVVAADGANSFVRNFMQIPVETRDYRQTAIICNITPAKAHQGRAWEFLSATGPFALLPHTGKRCGLVWSVASDEAQDLLAMDDASFLQAAQQRFGSQLGDFLEAGKRSAYPLKLVRAKQDVGERLLILGNAAHAIHPVGAQGFNLALRDIAVLAEILADSDGDDPGNKLLLEQYSRWRGPDQRSTIAHSDGLTRLFAHPSVLVAGIRTASLMAHKLLPGLRRQTASRAMGYGGRVPRLALGEPLSYE